MENLVESKKYLLNAFLYPTSEAKTFFVSELNGKLESVICEDKLFAQENLIDEAREINYWETIKAIGNFLCQNAEYCETLHNIYEGETFLGIIKLVLIHYVYLCVSNSDVYKEVNFFNCPECILYKQMGK